MRNLRAKGQANTGGTSDAQMRSSLVSRMEEMEANFQRGLEQLRSEYVQPKPGDNNDRKSENFAQKFDQFEKATKDALNDLKQQILDIQTHNNKLQQESQNLAKRNNLKKLIFHGIAEKYEKNLIDCICNVVTSSLGIALNKNDISSCSRMGNARSTTNNNNTQSQNQNPKNRPVVVAFVHQWKRDDVYYAKKKFKDSGVVVSEMLVKSQYDLFLKSRDIHKNNTWTIRGEIFVFTNNRKICIKSISDLQSIK